MERGEGIEPGVAALVEAEAAALLGAAEAAGLPMRLIGSIAIRRRCPEHVHVLDALGRRPVRDVDLVAYHRDDRGIEKLFEGRGYVLDPVIRRSREFGLKRLVYHDAGDRWKVDVFLDQLVMSHTVDLRGRLELERVTVPLGDLLLSKLQIHEVTENDLIDTAVLLGEHSPVEGGHEGIHLGRVCDVLCDDWGFHRTARENLEKLGSALERFDAMPSGSADAVRERSATIERRLDEAPKTRRWRRRARLGTWMRWYEDVEEVDR